MKVLSLFDGMSCGQIALKELGTIPDDESEDVYNGKPLEGNGPDWTEDVHP